MTHTQWIEVGRRYGLNPLDTVMFRALALSGVSMLGLDIARSRKTPEDLCRALADTLSASRFDDGAIVTARGLRKIRFSAHEAAAFEELLGQVSMQEFEPDTALDTAIEILICTFNSAGYELAQGFDDPLLELANIPDGASVACIFPLAAPTALHLSHRCSVEFHCADQTVAVLCTLLSAALRVDLRIFLPGSIFETPSRSHYAAEHLDLGQNYDHIITFPPLGRDALLQSGRALIGEAIEQGQFFHLRDRWKSSFTTVISDRQLFKGQNHCPEFFKWVVSLGLTRMVKLPSCHWGPNSVLQIHVVRIENSALAA